MVESFYGRSSPTRSWEREGLANTGIHGKDEGVRGVKALTGSWLMWSDQLGAQGIGDDTDGPEARVWRRARRRAEGADLLLLSARYGAKQRILLGLPDHLLDALAGRSDEEQR